MSISPPFGFITRGLLIAGGITWISLIPCHADLSLAWNTVYGSTALDRGQAIVVDALGQSWVSGATHGDLGGSPAGSADLFLSRISAGGNVDFTVKRGGNVSDSGLAVALVGSNTVFSAGITDSNTYDGATALGNSDALAVRYDTNGLHQSTLRFGGTSDDEIGALAGNSTNLLMVGKAGTSFDAQTLQGSYDAFISKRDSSGALLWTRFAGTSGSETGRAAAFDASGNAYLAGDTDSSFAGFTQAGNGDIFIARYDSSGNRTLLKQVGSPQWELAFDMQVDLAGNIYVAGMTMGSLGGQTSHGLQDAFVMKLDSGGNLLWTRLFGTSTNESANGLGIDSAGNVWIGGSTYSDSLGNPNSNPTNSDGFVAKYDSNGNLLDTIFIATESPESIQALAIGPDGAVYVTGYTYSSPSGNGADVFVAKIVPEPSGTLLLLTGTLLAGLRRRRR